MKKAKGVMYKFVAGFALIVTTFWGCKDQLNKTGFDLLLPGDLISARKITVDKTTIKSFTVLDERLRTNKPHNSLLGTFNDPIFGKTTADFACQFRLDSLKDFTGATPDKLILTLLYYETYGDRVTPQNLKIYELNKALNGSDDFIYYQGVDLKSYANSEVLAENSYVPKFKRDSITNLYGSTKLLPKDTVIQKIKFYLNNTLAQKLMAFKVTKDEKFPNDRFLEYFKGLYIEAGDLNDGGDIMRIVSSAKVPTLINKIKTSILIDSEMKLYFHHPKDTIQDSAIYKINSHSARTSQFKHYEYLTSRFKTNLNKTQEQDTLIFLQTTGGLSDKIYLPTLSYWKDSVNCAINKAELVFHVEKGIKGNVDTLLYETSLYPLPQKIKLSLIDSKGSILDTLGNVIYPSDLGLGEAYYGGTYNALDGTYRFNLANFLQNIIKRKMRNYGFYLTTDNKTAIFRRLVLKGATSRVGIGFDISYSKLK